MRRSPRIYHRSRTNINNLLSLMRAEKKWPLTKWPARLKAAYELLHEELDVPAEHARTIVVGTTDFAHKCSVDITQMAVADERQSLCRRGSKYFNKFAINLGRLPAKLRRSIQDVALPLIADRVFDSERLDDLLNGIVSQLLPHAAPKSDAERVLRAIYCDPPNERGSEKWDRRPRPLAVLYSGLHPLDRMRAETAVNDLLASEPNVSAGELFRGLGTALADQSPSRRSAAFEAIVEFVEKTAELWRAHGLTPTRGNYNLIPNYWSAFHRFVDLLLTEMTEPGSRRGHAGTETENGLHQEKLDVIQKQIYAARNALPPDVRPFVGASLPRRDVFALVSEDHLRKALSKARGIKPAAPKTPPQTPSKVV